MTEFGREYGEGLYALCAEEGIAQPVLEEMKCLSEAFRQNPDLTRLLSNMTLSKQERVGIVDQFFRGQVNPYVLNFLKILVERGGIFAFRECVKAYQENYNRDHQVLEAEVTTARPLDGDQRERLMGKLRQMTGKEVILREKVDETVMGGVLLQMDGKRYDNTVRHRLDAIRQAMLGE